MGPLAIARGSHNDGLLDHVEQEVYSYILQGRKQVGIPVEDVRQTWLTIDYRPGDALIFHSQAIHRAFPNTSDRIRLSFDTRCQPKTIPRTWQMEKTTLELRKYRQDAQRLATEEGASEELFEVLIIEMMKRGIPVDRERIKALMAELSVEQQ